MPMSPRLLRPIASSLDPDAAVYLNAVAAADGEQLEPAVKKAINDFVRDCKSDGIWSAIKRACFFCGPRTLNGAAVSLVGQAATNQNFVSGDYNRKSGILNSAFNNTKRINANYPNDVSQQANRHDAVYIHTPPSASGRMIWHTGANPACLGRAVEGGSDMAFRSWGSGDVNLTGYGRPAGFFGVSRNSVSLVTARISGANFTTGTPASTPAAGSLYWMNSESGFLSTDARVQFFSAGDDIDLALFDARVAAYVAAIDAAI